MSNWVSQEGSPFPLVVSFVEEDDAFNFAIYSKHADRVTLLLFTEDDLQTPSLRLELDYLCNKSEPKRGQGTRGKGDGGSFPGMDINCPLHFFFAWQDRSLVGKCDSWMAGLPCRA